MRTLVLLVLTCLPAAALTVDEVIELSDAGVADEIIINQMKSDGSAFELSAREIVNLQKKKVPATVINFMVQARGKAPVARAAGEPAPTPMGPPLKAELPDAALVVRNLSNAKITVIVYPHDRLVALVKGDIASGTVLANGSHARIPLPGGLYQVRWTNEAPFREIAVTRDATLELEFRDDDQGFRHVKAVVLLDGQEEPDPNAPRVTEVAARTEPAPPRVYQSPTNSSVTVIREVVQAPTRVVIAGRSPCDTTVGWADDSSWYVEPAYRPRIQVGYSWGSSPSYYGNGCSPAPVVHHYDTHRHSGYRSSPHSYSHYGHSSHGRTSHGYSRTADNVQYYLNWPFGHRHR